MSAEAGLGLLDAALAAGRPGLVPLRLDPAALRSAGAALPPMFSKLAGPPSRPAAGDGAAAAAGLAARLAALAPEQALRVVTDLVAGHTGVVLGHAAPVGAERPFTELGLDSLTSVELRNRLTAATGLQLPATLAFDYPTPAAVAGRLLAELRPAVAVVTEEDQLRQAFAAIPISRLRSAGILETLLSLAGIDTREGIAVDGDEDEEIDAMDTESLISMALAEAEMTDD
jgi:acyl carrier protein